MAISANTAVTFALVGNREDLVDQIYNISPVDLPFQANIGKVKATAVLHEWQSDTLAAAAANAQLEGDDKVLSSGISAGSSTTRLQNRCQISDKSVQVSGTADAINKAGRKKEIVYQLMKRGKELRRDMEFVLTNNQTPATGSSTSARALRPLVGWYSTNRAAGSTSVAGGTASAATDSTSLRPLTESLVKSTIQSIWTNGGDADLIMSGPFNKTVISGFNGNTTRMQNTEDGKLNTAISVYVSDFGTHKVVANRFSRERDLHILTTDLWAVASLRPMQTIDLAKTGDAERGLILAEYTLECRQETGSGTVPDLTTS